MKQYNASIFGWSKIDRAMRQAARDVMGNVGSTSKESADATHAVLSKRLLDIFGADTEINLINKINLIEVEARLQKAISLNQGNIRGSSTQLLTEKGLIPLLEHYAILPERADDSEKEAEIQRMLFSDLMESVSTNRWNPMAQNDNGNQAYRFHLRTCLGILRVASEVLASHQDEEETQKEIGAVPSLSQGEEEGLYKLCDILFDQVLQPEEELSTLVYLQLERNQVRTTSTGSEIAGIAAKLSRYQQYRRRTGKADPISAEAEDFETRQARAKREETERVLSALPESRRQTAVPVEELAVAPNWDNEEANSAEAKADLQAYRQESQDEKKRKTADQPNGPKLGRLPENPLDWVWTGNARQQPLEYIVEYAGREVQGLLETASRELSEMEGSTKDVATTYPLGDAAQRIFNINSSRTNPNTLWSVASRLAAAADKEGEPTPAQFEMGEDRYARMIANISVAKLHLFLSEICPKYGMDAKDFHAEWAKTCAEAAEMKSPKRRDELLIETAMQLRPQWADPKNRWEMNQWLQDLRLQGMGGYEDSLAADNARRKLLGQVNTILELSDSDNLEDTIKSLSESWANDFEGLNQPFYANVLRASVKFLNEKGDATAKATGKETSDWIKGASQRIVKRTGPITDAEKEEISKVIANTLTAVSKIPGKDRIADRQVANNPYSRLADTINFLKKWSQWPDAGERELNTLRQRGQAEKAQIETATSEEASEIEPELAGVNLDQLRAGRYLELSCDRARMILHIRDTILEEAPQPEDLKGVWTQNVSDALDVATMRNSSGILLKEAAQTLAGTAVLAKRVPEELVRPWQVKLLKRVSHRIKTRATAAEVGEESTPVKLSQSEMRGIMDTAYSTGLYFSQDRERLDQMTESATTTLKKFTPVVELWKTRPDLETDVKRLVREKQTNLTQTEEARMEEILGFLNEKFESGTLLKEIQSTRRVALGQTPNPQQSQRETALAEPTL